MTEPFDVQARIVELRVRNGWSVAEMARECDISRGALEKYIRGTARPAFESIWKICKRTGCTPNWLVFGVDMDKTAIHDALVAACTHSGHTVVQRVLSLIDEGNTAAQIAEKLRLHGTVNTSVEAAMPWVHFFEEKILDAAKVTAPKIGD